MLKLSAKVEISGEKKWVFEKITACEIVSAISEPSDFCKLTLPRKVKWKGESSNPIKRGDKISVWLGYDDNLQLAFTGYVRSVSSGSPCVLDCEDEFFNYHSPREIPVCFNINASPVDFLRALGLKSNAQDNSGYTDVTGFQAGEVDEFRNSVYSGAHWLWRNYKIASKFLVSEDKEDRLLFIFDPLEDNSDIRLVLKSGVNIISTRNLKFTDPADSKAFVKIGSVESCYYVGSAPVYHEHQKGDDVPGAMRLVASPEGWSDDSVKRTVNRYFEIFTRGGLSGSITTFGSQLISVCDKVAVILDGNKMGVYNIANLKIVYDRRGFRQIVTLGLKISD